MPASKPPPRRPPARNTRSGNPAVRAATPKVPNAPTRQPRQPAASRRFTPPIDDTNEVPPLDGASYPQLLRVPGSTAGRSLAGVGLAVLIFYIMSSVVSQLVVAVGYAIERQGTWPEFYRQAFAFERPVGMLGANLGIAIAIPIAWALLAVLHRMRPRWLGSVQPGLRWRYLAICLPVAAVSLLGLQLLVSGLVPVHPQQGLAGFVVVILLTSPLQAAAEEILFRGYLLQALGSLVGRPWFGIVVSSVVFALLHGTQNLPLFADRLAFGVVAALLVWRTGGLEAGIAAHVVNNILAFGLAGLTTSIATLRAVRQLSWAAAGVDVGSFALFALLAYLVARAMRLRRTVDLAAVGGGGLGGDRSLQ